MMAVLTRLIALITALALFAFGGFGLLQVHPENLGGGAVWLALLAGLALACYAIYRAMTRGLRDRAHAGSAVGAGLLMGAAVESARQRRSDDDGFEDGLDEGGVF